MPEISEQVTEAVEKAEGEHEGGEGPSRLNTIVAMSVAITATFMAVSHVKGGNVDQAMAKAQVELVDAWSFYQAKSTKQSLVEAAAEQLTVQRDILPADAHPALAENIEAYKKRAARYEKEKDEIKAKVDALEKRYEQLNVKDDQFDMCEALLSVAIALFGITALTQKRWMMFVAGSFGAAGVFLGLAGFAGWNVRPEWLARLLGA
jgi:hypothetical protein